MTEAQAVEAILEAWDAGWRTLHPGSSTPIDKSQALCVPWTTDNEAFTTDALGALQAWVRIVVRHSTRDQTTHGPAGARRFEATGNVFVQLFTPVNAGQKLLAMLADDTRTVLEGIRSGALVTYGGATREGDEDGTWAMSLVTIQFRYTETR